MVKICTGVVDEIDPVTRLCRFLIDDRRSTVILHRWIGIDHRHRPYSPVSESASTVDIDRDRSTGSINRWTRIGHRYLDRCWDHFSPPMGPWVLGGCVSRTISHHLRDHRSIVLFFNFSQKRGRPIFFRYEFISTVDFDGFFSQIDGRCDIDRIFN